LILIKIDDYSEIPSLILLTQRAEMCIFATTNADHGD